MSPVNDEISVGESGFRRYDRPDTLFVETLQEFSMKQGVGGSQSGAFTGSVQEK